MRKICFALMTIFSVLPCDFAQSQTVKVPSRWIGGPPVLLPGKKGTFDDTGVKDPSIVNHRGRWHLFYTVSGKEPGGTGYVSAESLDLLKTAPRHKSSQVPLQNRLLAGYER
jgi:hypothetical protein